MCVPKKKGRLPMSDDIIHGEEELLKAYALRWAVLAAWQASLLQRGVRTHLELDKQLQSSRVKITSGCFSSCEVSCDLSAVESQLISMDGSCNTPEVDTWLDLLGKAMTQPDETAGILSIPAVKVYFTSCLAPGCTCSD